MFPQKISQNIDILVNIHRNAFPWHPAIMGNKASSLCFKYHSPGFISSSTMLAPVISSLDEIYCTDLVKITIIVFHDSGTLNIGSFSICLSVCMSRNTDFSFTQISPLYDVCHTTLFSPMYVTQPRILRCMSHHPVFSNVCHTVQNSPMYVTPSSFLQCMKCATKSILQITLEKCY